MSAIVTLTAALVSILFAAFTFVGIASKPS